MRILGRLVQAVDPRALVAAPGEGHQHQDENRKELQQLHEQRVVPPPAVVLSVVVPLPSA
eukprot:scaffold576_cov260-Pinguiococcus_pyrenoidosus.AAC.24